MVKRCSICAIIIMYACCLLTFVGCDKEEKCIITFNYNVGNLIYSMEEKEIEVKKDDLIRQYPGNGIDCGQIEGYYIEGWYTAKMDNAGNILINSNRFVELDKKWNFEKDTVTENIILFANWVKDPPTSGFYTIAFYYELFDASGKYLLTLGGARQTVSVKYNQPITSSYDYDHLARYYLEYVEYKGKIYDVEFWYVPKLGEDELIVHDDEGFAVVDRIWDYENDLITHDMEYTYYYAKAVERRV